MFMSTAIGRPMWRIALGAIIALTAPIAYAANASDASAKKGEVSDRQCTGKEIFMARLRSGGATIGKVYVYHEGGKYGKLCAVTTRGYNGPRADMEIKLWGTYKGKVIHRGSNPGDFTMYAGRLRLPYGSGVCYRVFGSIGNATATTLDGRHHRRTGCLRS